MISRVALFGLLLIHSGYSWNPTQQSSLSRRKAFGTVVEGLVGATALSFPAPAFAIDDSSDKYRYEKRKREDNKDALVKEDFYYVTGTVPPRKLDTSVILDDPQWNAFGSCATNEATGNSCTYVSLKQRQPAYSKYAAIIFLGAREYKLLGEALSEAAKTGSDAAWQKAASYVTVEERRPPPPAVDAALKMVLLGSGLCISPNYNGPSKEFLAIKFYVNESAFAMKEITDAISKRDSERALAAWDFGKDSWNSYFQLVNGRISAKVGDKFDLIE